MRMRRGASKLKRKKFWRPAANKKFPNSVKEETVQQRRAQALRALLGCKKFLFAIYFATIPHLS